MRSIIPDDQQVGENELTIDVSDLPAGIYFVKIVNKSNTQVQKLFIK